MQRFRKRLKHVLFKIEEFRASFGRTIDCPVCHHAYDHFYTYNQRSNAMCYHCRALERDRFLFLYLTYKTDLFLKPVNLLHFAPEISLYPQFRQSANISYYTADYMVTLNSYLQAMPEYIMSITDIKFQDNMFDYIICSHVLDDVDDDRKALKEMYRVLKSKGQAIIAIPVDLKMPVTVEFDETPEKKLLKQHMKISDENKRLYGADFTNILTDAGFEVSLISSSSMNDTSKNYALRKSDCLYLCTKK